MNNATILLEELSRKWSDKTLALIAADAVEEQENCGRRVALQVVGKVRRAAKNSDEVRRATCLITKGSRRRRMIIAEMLLSLHFRPYSACTIYTVPGSRKPAVGVPLDDTGPIEGYGPAITVGARWILECNESIRAAEASHRRWRALDKSRR